MESKKGTLNQAKKNFEKLKTDVNSVMFTEEKIDNRLSRIISKKVVFS